MTLKEHRQTEPVSKISFAQIGLVIDGFVAAMSQKSLQAAEKRRKKEQKERVESIVRRVGELPRLSDVVK